MRIESIDRVSQMYRTSQVSKVTGPRGAAAPGRDRLSISRTGQDYQIAKQAVSRASDIREDKVADVKSKIDSGTYEVSVDDFAAKLLEKYGELS